MLTDVTYNASSIGGAMKRIRAPHEHDVLSGRGGGINGHAGNVKFRQWVNCRKNEYNLAPNKAEKARVAREVIDLVRSQDPPGRFLQKESSLTGWWVEVDDEKVMAKTSQALREGAPQIRAAHKDELRLNKQRQKKQKQQKQQQQQKEQQKQHAKENDESAAEPTSAPVVSTRYTSCSPPPVSSPRSTTEPLRRAFAEAMAQPSAAGNGNKRVRIDSTGTFSRPADVTPPLGPVKARIAIDREDSMPILPPSSTIPSLRLNHDGTIGSGTPAASRTPMGTNSRNSSNNSGGITGVSRDADGMRRVHSLAGSESDGGLELLTDEFVNPFEDDAESYALQQHRRHRQQQQNNHRILSTDPDTLLMPCPVVEDPVSTVDYHHDMDFNEGMKMIYDALHPDVEEDTIPTFLYPYLGPSTNGSTPLTNNNNKKRKLSGNIVSSQRGVDGKQ